MLTAIIVAAGSSKRIGFDKLSASIAGKPVLQHTVEAFERTASVEEIVIVSRADRLSEFQDMLRFLTKVTAIIPGGEHRHNSVEAGLRRVALGARYVAVHDGARPLITPIQIEEVFQQAQVHEAASLAEPMADTLKRANQELMVDGSIDRHQLYAMQTPQIFERFLLEQAYNAVSTAGWRVTDEVSAVELLGRKVKLVLSTDVNFKITYERDLQLAETVLLARQGRN